MTRVLLALVGVAAALGIALMASVWLGSSRTEKIAVRFMELYTTGSDLGDLEGYASIGFMRGGTGDEYVRDMRVVRRHMGKFLGIEKRLLERERRLGPAYLCDLQFVGAFEKGSALVKLAMVEMEEEWRVDAVEVEIPPKLMRRSPAEFAEMIALEAARRLSRGEFPAVLSMVSEDFSLKYPQEVIADALAPLLTERTKLTGVGVVEAETAGVNRRRLRVIALFEDGLPLGFDMQLVWGGNRWRVDELTMEDAPGATIPPDQLRPPVRERRRGRKQR